MRLIDADKLIDKGNSILKTPIAKKQFVDLINTMPSYTIKDTKISVWNLVSPFTDTIECALCKYQFPSDEFATKYCPGCGARMGDISE